MSLSKEQVEELLQNIGDNLNKMREGSEDDNFLLAFCEIQLKDLEMSRQNEIAAEKALNELITNENSSISTKYVELKDNYDELRQKYENLLKETQIQKRNYEDHIQMVIDSNTMILDERETVYKQQLVEISNKIRFLQNSNRELHMRLNSMRQNQPRVFSGNVLQSNVLNFQGNPGNNNNIQNYFDDLDPENRDEENLDDFALLNAFKSNVSRPKEDTINVDKETQKNTTKNNSDDSTVILEEAIQKSSLQNSNNAIQRKPVVYGGYGRKNISNRSNIVPPLKPCTSSGTNNNYEPKKKRKLYDPDQTAYVESSDDDN